MTEIKSIKDLPLEEKHVFPALHSAQDAADFLPQGTGLKALGEKDCGYCKRSWISFSPLSIYPFTPFKGSWLYTLHMVNCASRRTRCEGCFGYPD